MLDKRSDIKKKELFQKQLQKAKDEMNNKPLFYIEVYFKEGLPIKSLPEDYKVYTLWGSIVSESSYDVCCNKVRNAFKNKYLRIKDRFISIDVIDTLQVKEFNEGPNEN
jgi:hypothetical protein